MLNNTGDNNKQTPVIGYQNYMHSLLYQSGDGEIVILLELCFHAHIIVVTIRGDISALFGSVAKVGYNRLSLSQNFKYSSIIIS